ncbi:hypothetical protein HF086_008551 [Spodoptera exigua]|uniref:Ornithine decarboxylase n=1 Tax=Spodoptera exigua TaxID=7107 RepID=A0A922S953_SPOEX|nr:hypothetical protein HF086_008551 [Spodoptera exigua]
MKVVEEEQLITVMDGPWSPTDLIREIVESGTQEDPFYVMDLGEVVARYHRWKELMPRVEPFYVNKDSFRRIIFANPAKMASHIRYASAVGVDVMTFDSETELMKIKQYMPHAQLVIRIRCDAASAQCPLGIKFGCDPVTEAPRLLKLAAVFGLDVAEVINGALEEHFPERSVRVVAEPGRYFAAAAYTLAAMVAAKDSAESETHTMYFINDGVYGSFNCVLYDHQHVVAEPLNDNGSAPAPCSVWGPTCDGLDCVLPATRLPRLAIGDWLIFRDMGAYTLPVASPFNGFPVPTVRPVVDARLACILKELRPLSASQFAAGRAVEFPPAPPRPGSGRPPSRAASPCRAVFVECALK